MSITDLWEEHGRLRKQTIRLTELMNRITLNLLAHLQMHHNQKESDDPRKYVETVWRELQALTKEQMEA